MTAEERFPFLLPGHLRVRKDRLPASAWATCETIVEHDRHVIVRLPAEPFTLQPAQAPGPDATVKNAVPGFCAVAREAGEILEKASAEEIARVARDCLGRLAALTRRGDGTAAWAFASLAAEATEGLSQMVARAPEAFRPLARRMARWPMMRSTHPRNCDNDAVLDKIELGRAVPVTLDKHSKWKPGFAATVAMRLYEHLEKMRASREVQARVGRRNVPLEKHLGPFNRDTAPVWWEYAVALLEASYGDLATVKELEAIITAPTHKKPLSRARQYIKDTIHASFLHIATYRT